LPLPPIAVDAVGKLYARIGSAPPSHLRATHPLFSAAVRLGQAATPIQVRLSSIVFMRDLEKLTLRMGIGSGAVAAGTVLLTLNK
jgi:hypothetical protein